jgi:hypothetical protein
MIKKDLKYIFKPQLDEGTTKLYFILIDGLTAQIQRHPADDLDGLVPLLDNFRFVGYKPGNLARFEK